MAPALRGLGRLRRARRRPARHGLEYLNTELPTATLFPDGGAAFLTTSLEDNVAELERHAAGDGAAWRRQFEEFMGSAELSFGVLSAELWSLQGLGLARKAYGSSAAAACSRSRADRSSSARDWLGATFASERAHGLLAPWVLHTGLGPEQAVSGFMTQVIACAVQLGGMPVPQGGGDPARRGARGDRARGRRRAAHRRRRRARADRGRPGDRRAARAAASRCTPRAPSSRASRRRSSTGGCCARSEAPPEVWRSAAGASATAAPACRSTSRSTSRRSGPRPRPSGSRAPRSCTSRPGLDGVSRAVNEAERGLLPAEATIVVGQPCAVDPSRAPDGKLDHLDPAAGAAAAAARATPLGEIDVGDGTWTEALREAYADRIVARLGTQITNLAARDDRSASCSRPPTSRRLDCNLVGGDIYAGSCALDQNLLWRPTGRAAGPRDAGRRALADRRLDASRARARRGLGLPRRQAAAEARRSPRASPSAAPARSAKLRGRLPL